MRVSRNTLVVVAALAGVLGACGLLVVLGLMALGRRPGGRGRVGRRGRATSAAGDSPGTAGAVTVLPKGSSRGTTQLPRPGAGTSTEVADPAAAPSEPSALSEPSAPSEPFALSEPSGEDEAEGLDPVPAPVEARADEPVAMVVEVPIAAPAMAPVTAPAAPVVAPAVTRAAPRPATGPPSAAPPGLRFEGLAGATGGGHDIDFSPEVPELPQLPPPAVAPSSASAPGRRVPVGAGATTTAAPAATLAPADAVRPPTLGRPPTLPARVPGPTRPVEPASPPPLPAVGPPPLAARPEAPPTTPTTPSAPRPTAQPPVQPEPQPEPGPQSQPQPEPAPRGRPATKAQQAQLAGLPDRLAPITDRQQVAAEAMREAAELIRADTTALVVRSLHGPRILWQHPDGADEPELWGVRTLAALLARPEPVRLSVPGDPLSGGGRTALVTAPVAAVGGAIGVVVARRHSGKAFTAADEDALNRLARICGVRLTATAERTAVALSALDPATRLRGHELLMNDVAATLTEVEVHGLPTSLVVAEVVGLPRLRTAEGMGAADAAVAEVAGRIGAQLRIGDVLYRLSADELAILLPATDAEGGAAVAARLDACLPGADADGGRALSLRAVAVPVEGPTDSIMLTVMRELAAARVTERWSGPTAVVPDA